MIEEVVKKQKGFTLPDKKVTVRFINRKRGMASNKWVTEDHAISGGMLTKATKKIPVPLMKNKSLLNVLTKEEKEFLESQDGLGMNLSVYSNKEFWENRYVVLRKGDNILDLSDPIDYIDYKILLANKDKIAPSLKHKNDKLTYWFAIVEENEEFQIEKESFNYKKKAFKLYSKIEDNSNILRGIIKLIDKKPISTKTKLAWLQHRVEKIIDNSPRKFVSVIEDTNYETKILISNAEDAGVIIIQNRKYMTSDGIELCEEGEIASFDNAVKYLSKPKNNELLDMIKLKIEKASK